MKMTKINFLISLFFLVLGLGWGCSPVTNSDNDADPTQFFNIVYIAEDSTSIYANDWISVEGQYEFQFTPEVTTDSTGNQQTVGGNFTFYFNNYLEPQLCPYGEDCRCSGGVQGTYIDVTDQQSTTTSPSASPSPYNANEPYTPSTPGASPTPEASSEAIIYTYYFQITVGSSALGTGCPNESNRTLELIRYSDGSIVLTDWDKAEFFEPLVTNN